MAGQPVNRREAAQRILLAMLFLIVLSLAVPLIFGAILGVDAGVILAFIGATFALQAASPPLGLAFGLSPWFILLIMAFFALGIVVAIREACDALALVSTRVRAWIARLEQKTEKHPFIKRYGAVSCIMIAWIPGIGLYGTPVISWILRWKRVPSLLFTTLGFVIAAAFVLVFANQIQDIDHLLSFAGNAGVVIFVIAGMLSIGFSMPRSRLVLPTRNLRLFVPALAANFIAVPVVAWLLAAAAGLSAAMGAGLVLMGLAAGATFLPRLDRIARADPDPAEGTAVIMTAASIVTLPLLLPFLIHGEVAALEIALPLVLLIAVPLGIGLFIRSRYERIAVRLTGTLSKVSFIAMIVLFVAYFLSYYQNLPAIFVTGAILALILFIVAAFVIGFLAGEGGVARVRRASALGTAQRNLAAAFVVAAISLRDPELLVTVLVTGLAGLFILAGLGKYMAAQGVSRVNVEDDGPGR